MLEIRLRKSLKDRLSLADVYQAIDEALSQFSNS